MSPTTTSSDTVVTRNGAQFRHNYTHTPLGTSIAIDDGWTPESGIFLTVSLVPSHAAVRTFQVRKF